jgi:hypothetical protein
MSNKALLDPARRDLIRDLTEQLIAEVAPDETELFEEIWRDCTGPGKRPKIPKADPLSFGVADAVTLVTPTVIAVTTTVVAILWLEAQKALGVAAKDYFDGLRARLQKRQEKPSGGTTVPPATKSAIQTQLLTPEFLARVRDLTQSVARKEGLDETVAETVSLKLIARLALPQ